MDPTVALSAAALCGGLLLVMAVTLFVAFPQLTCVRNWSLSWFLAALGCFFTAVRPTLETYFAGNLDLTLRTFFALGSALALVLGFLNWFNVSPDRGKGVLARTFLWGGSVVVLVLAALGLDTQEFWAWCLAAGWALVPVTASIWLLARFGIGEGPGPVRAQSWALVWATALGPAPFMVSWVVLSEFPGTGWSFGFPPFLVLGAALTFRALVHFDTRFHHHHATSFLVQKTQDTVLFLQADGKIQASNPAVRVLLDTDEVHLVGRHLGALAADAEASRVLGPLESLSFPDWEGTLNLVHRTGRPVPVHLVFRRIHNPARETVGAVLLLYDLRLPRQLDLTSREDLLTALSNRRWVLELLEAEFQRVKRYGGLLSAFWIEVDHLDLIRDRTGREGADEVLRKVASVLRGCLRKTDFCGRVGAREFLAVLPETSAERASVVVGRLEKMFALAAEEGFSEAALRIGMADLDSVTDTADDFVARVRASVPADGSSG